MRMQFTTRESLEPSPQISPAASWPARYARFGNFQVDLQREQLYQEGRRVKVQAKSYQALQVLLGRAGEIVTREEVRKRLWRDAVHINFDANVNTTMNKLRLVLGDSTDHPVYIETVPRSGYCFIAEVEFSDQPLPALSTNGAAPREAEQRAGPRKIWSLSSLCIQSTPLRIGSFVLLGMLAGALLVLAWTFVSSKSHRAEHLARHSTSLPASSHHKL
jgi:DNA-binding winged helix-turn-helix (wHTH) protein